MIFEDRQCLFESDENQVISGCNSLWIDNNDGAGRSLSDTSPALDYVSAEMFRKFAKPGYVIASKSIKIINLNVFRDVDSLQRLVRISVY